MTSRQTRTSLIISLADAQSQVGHQLNRGTSLRERQIENEVAFKVANADYETWRSYTTELLKQIFNNEDVQMNFH